MSCLILFLMTFITRLISCLTIYPNTPEAISCFRLALIQVYFRLGGNFRRKTDKSVVPSFAGENGLPTPCGVGRVHNCDG